MITRALEAVLALPRQSRAPGLAIAQLHESVLGRPLDPFLMCDCFEMAEPFFPPHPHAGFSAVTYMLRDSANGFVNRDSRGDRSLIQPGDLHWTEAARGMMHEEVPIIRGAVCHGLQLFVNLPAREKLAEPRVYHLDADAVPRLRQPGAELRVLAGTFAGAASPVQPRTACALVDVELEPEAHIELSIEASWNAVGLLVQGGLADHAAAPIAALRFAAHGDGLALAAGPKGATVILLLGAPLREPLAFGGPFVMSDAAQLHDARRRFGQGEMGHLEASF